MPLNLTRDGHSHFPVVTSSRTQRERAKTLLAAEVDTFSALSSSAIFASEWDPL